MLKFQSLASSVDVAFWQELARQKLEVIRLSTEPIPIVGSYSAPTRSDLPARMCVGQDAFGPVDAVAAPGKVVCHGWLHLTNTVEDFKRLDKVELQNMHAQTLLDAMADNGVGVAADPSILSGFRLIVFADLKKHTFTYWFCFPALCTPTAITSTGLSGVPEELLSTGTPDAFFAWNSNGEVITLAEVAAMAPEDRATVTLGFIDPCGLAEHPGWPLRNLLFLAAAAWGMTSVRVACIRQLQHGAASPCPSLLLQVDLPPTSLAEVPRVVGWELNNHGKAAPRRVNLSSTMDPARLAETSVDLNLKLMRWRLLPSLDVDMLGNTKCLLLGAGTLGCTVARDLLGWGVRHITLVDNGSVSYSNPVRQSLFTFEDCQQGRPKAEAAAEALQRIFPAVTATGHRFTIPMPGHALSSADEATAAQEATENLSRLIDEHDVIFLLTDTRESRWLPTLLGLAADKVVLNAALGLDTYVVLRHGARGGQADGPKLGCYFCNDIVAPTDSTRDRTLDQQCTVTRPGLAPIAGALAVELMVGLLHHPVRHRAPADGPVAVNAPVDAPLGLLPHQVRGYLTHFQNVINIGHAFDRCPACSDSILEAFETEGFAFLARVFNDSSFLEQVTGLDQLAAQMDAIDIEDWDSESEF